MKHFLVISLLSIITLFFTGCSATVDTANMQPEERLNYAISLYDDESYEQAILELEAILIQYPGNSFIDKAQYYLGMTRFKRGEYIIAASEFSRLIRNMPASIHLPDAQFMLGECYYTLSPKYSLDQRYTKQSIQELQSFIDYFPTDPRVTEAETKIGEMNTKLAEKEYNNAYIYEKLEYYNAAITYYDNVVNIYHDTRFAPLASYKKIQLLIDKNRFSEALSEVESFLVKYPQDSNYSDVLELKEKVTQKLTSIE